MQNDESAVKTPPTFYSYNLIDGDARPYESERFKIKPLESIDPAESAEQEQA